MLEPAAYGANVAFGPQTSNFRDIVELLLAGDAASRIDSLDDIENWLIEQLRNPQAGIARGGNAQQVVAAQQGAVQRTARLLLELLAADEQANSRSKRAA